MQKRALILGLVTLLSSPSLAAEYLRERESRPLLGSIVSVEICYVDGRQDDVDAALDRVWNRLEDLNVRLNPYNPKSDLSALNASAETPLAMSEDMLRLLKVSREFHETTGGAFDVTIKPLYDVWTLAEKEGRYPAASELAAAKARLGLEKIKISYDRFVTRSAGVAVDFSGLAQGYAADQAAGILKDESFHNFLVDTGGEIVTRGVNCDGKAWSVGLEDPDNPGAVMDRVMVSDAAISTSGDYQKFFTIQGERWPKIINPVSGYPARGVASATVIAPTALEADVYSTALCVMGPVEGLKMIERLGRGYEAAIVQRRGEQLEWHVSPGYEGHRQER